MVDPGMRASDGDREAVIERLEQAHAEGRLTQEELSARVEAALTAKTFGELAPLTADLPAPLVPVRRPNPSAGREPVRRGSSPAALRAAWATWASVNLVCVVVWLLVLIGPGGTQGFWPVWVAGPWGAVLLARTIAARGEGRP